MMIKLKHLAIICLTIAFLSVIISMSTLSGLGVGEQAGIDIGAFIAYATAVGEIIRKDGKSNG